MAIADDVLQTREQTLLDLVDHLLNKGVVANGDVTLGVAGIDLIYLRLHAIPAAPRKSRRRQPSRLKRRP